MGTGIGELFHVGLHGSTQAPVSLPGFGCFGLWPLQEPAVPMETWGFQTGLAIQEEEGASFGENPHFIPTRTSGARSRGLWGRVGAWSCFHLLLVMDTSVEAVGEVQVPSPAGPG